jgi:hypothetical protein
LRGWLSAQPQALAQLALCIRPLLVRSYVPAHSAHNLNHARLIARQLSDLARQLSNGGALAGAGVQHLSSKLAGLSLNLIGLLFYRLGRAFHCGLIAVRR